jgi:hypothetical protein
MSVEEEGGGKYYTQYLGAVGEELEAKEGVDEHDDKTNELD